jgi:hypothetical protein
MAEQHDSKTFDNEHDSQFLPATRQQLSSQERFATFIE